MAQPTGSTPTLSTYPTNHTRRAGDLLAVVMQSMNSGTGDGTMDYGADAMTALLDQAGPAFSFRVSELFTRLNPASGSQAVTAGGTGTPRGVAIRTYDTTTGTLLNVAGAADDNTSITITRAAPDANNLGQLLVYWSGTTATVAGTSGCTQVGATSQVDNHSVALFDVTGANPAVTLSSGSGWLAFAFDVEGTGGGGPTEYDASASDGVQWSDTPSQEAEAAPAATDGVQWTDTPSAAMEADVAAGDGIRWGETLDGTIESESPFPDEGIRWSDTPSSALEADAAAADGIRWGDSASATVDAAGDFSADAGDGTRWADTPVPELEAVPAAASGIRWSDGASCELEAAVSVSDGWRWSDQASGAIDGSNIFAGNVVGRLRHGPLYTARLRITSGAPMLLTTSPTLFELDRLRNRLEREAIAFEQITQARARITLAGTDTAVAGAEALAITLVPGPPVEGTLLVPVAIGALLDLTKTYDVIVTITMNDDSTWQVREEGIPAGPQRG